jgi:hypothetical protein
MFRAPRRKGYREFHPVTSPLVIAGAGFIAFWLAYGLVYLFLHSTVRSRSEL